MTKDVLGWVAKVPEVADPQLEIEQGNKWVLAVTGWVAGSVAGVIENEWKSATESAEDLDGLLIEKLEALDWELTEAMPTYKELLWEDYWNIEAAIMGIEYWPNPFLDTGVATVDNIQALALFSIIHKYDIDGQLAFFNWLVDKIKASSPEVQWYMLWLIEVVRMLLIAPKSEFADNSPEYLVIRENQQKAYEAILNRMFDYLTWDNSKWFLESAKYFFVTYKQYIKEWNTQAENMEFHKKVKSDPNFFPNNK